MKIVMFYHSLLSDWNHGNAHFLRGIVWNLLELGHDVRVYEPKDGWSISNLIAQSGHAAISRFYQYYPGLLSMRYDARSLDIDRALDDADLVIVHEWNAYELVANIGNHHQAHNNYVLLFHDTHHRSVTAPHEMANYDLSGYDGVLAFGRRVHDIYLKQGWARRAWVWHEAADTRIFKPLVRPKTKDLVWIGNWGDEERSQELREFLIEPAAKLKLRSSVYGVRYPQWGINELDRAGIDYRSYAPNFKVPEIFAGAKFTVHVPRRPYAASLAGIPTIRVFEALACKIPLICAPWKDTEGLFHPGEDYIIARNSSEMAQCMERILADEEFAKHIAGNGYRTIIERHTCVHRVKELMTICESMGMDCSPNKFKSRGVMANV